MILAISHAECFVLLHQHFPQCVCSGRYGCFLQFLDFVLPPGMLLSHIPNDFRRFPLPLLFTGANVLNLLYQQNTQY